MSIRINTIKAALKNDHIEFIQNRSDHIDLHNRLTTLISQTIQRKKHHLVELQEGIYCLSISKTEYLTPLHIKKLTDQAQYILLPAKHDQDPFSKISLSNFNNWCYGETTASPFLLDIQACELIFFFRTNTIENDFLDVAHRYGLSLHEKLTNRMLIMTNGRFEYPMSLARLISRTIFLNRPIHVLMEDEIKTLLYKFDLLNLLYEKLMHHFDHGTWTLDQGKMLCQQNGLSQPIDYASIIDDIIYCGFQDNMDDYVSQFDLATLNLHSFFPTVTVRSLIHLKARPNSLAIKKNGFALVAAKEMSGKQINIANHKKSLDFSLWCKRSYRHLFRHHYKARAIFSSSAKNTFALVGEQIATLALFPELVRGVFDALNLNAPKTVRLIAHNEDVLVVAYETASWVDINDVSMKGATLFKMVASDGADGLSLFQQTTLPDRGAGSFTLKTVPHNFFELIDAALTPKKAMPAGHKHYLLGLAYECLHEWELATQEYKKSLRFDALDPEILHALGSALMEVGRYKEALPFLKRAVSLAPENPEAANDWGRSNLECGLIHDAITAFENAVKLCPASADYLKNLSNSYIRAQRLNDAFVVLNKALRCDPSSAQTLTMLAFLHLNEGNEAEAKKHAMLAYREDPTDQNVVDLLWHLTVGKLS